MPPGLALKPRYARGKDGPGPVDFAGEDFFHELVQDRAPIQSAPDAHLPGFPGSGFEKSIGICEYVLRLFLRFSQTLVQAGPVPRYAPPVGGDDGRFALPCGGVLSIGMGGGAGRRYRRPG